MDAALNFQESLLKAESYRDKIRLRHLRQADAHLNKVGLYLRLVHQWGWLSRGQYEHVSRMAANIGPILKIGPISRGQTGPACAISSSSQTASGKP